MGEGVSLLVFRVEHMVTYFHGGSKPWRRRILKHIVVERSSEAAILAAEGLVKRVAHGFVESAAKSGREGVVFGMSLYGLQMLGRVDYLADEGAL